jgi:uncharacterized protein YoxC
MLWEISVLIASLAFLLLVIFAIPTLIQIRRTAKKAETSIQSLNQNLPGILTNIDEITTNVTQATQSVGQNIDGLKDVVNKFHLVADDVVQFEQTIRGEIEPPILDTLGTLSGIVKGIRTFVEVWRGKVE